MSETTSQRSKDWLRLSEGRTFPDPTDPNGVQWLLRYGEPSREDLLFAASVMSAYAALVYATDRVRSVVVREIRKEAKR